MSAAIIGLAFVAALNPKLLALDILFVESERPRLMFGCFLLGGMAVALTIGLLDVFVLRADAIKSQGQVSAGIDLAVGWLLLASAALIATGRLHGRRRPVPATTGPAGTEPAPSGQSGWAQRLLGKPRPGLAVLLGAVAGTPGAAYISALHQLVTGSSSAGAQAIAVFVFVVIEFLLVIVPFVLLELKPEGTRARLHSSQAWLMANARQLIAAVCLFVGLYLVISALVRLLS